MGIKLDMPRICNKVYYEKYLQMFPQRTRMSVGLQAVFILKFSMQKFLEGFKITLQTYGLFGL